MKTGGLDVARYVVFGVAVMAGLSGGALAQDKPAMSEAANAMIGAWEFSNADRDKICRFNFRSETVTGGYKLDIDRNCASIFPTTKDIVGWAVDNFGGLRLLDAGGNAVIELNEAEVGLYDGFEPEQGRYVLQSAAAVPVRSAEELVGDWAIARGTGKPLCILTLANNPAGTDALMLKRETRLRCHGYAFRAEFLAHGAERAGFAFGARTDLALRRERRQYLAARAGKFRPGSAGPSVIAVTIFYGEKHE